MAYPSGAPEFTPAFSGVRVTRAVVLCVCFVDRCLSFCTFSFGHCVVCSSSIYGFWLPLWYLQTLLVLLYFFCWPLCCLFFFDIRILITPLVSSNSSCPFVLFLLAIVLSVLLRYTDSDYPFGIFKLFLSFCTFSFGHCVVCSSSIYGFWLPLWYLQTLLVILYFFFWPLCFLFFFDIRILITPLVSSNSSCPFVLFLLAIVLSVLLRYTDSDYPFGIFKLFLSFCTFSFGHCVVCSSSIYGFWLPLWYLQTLLVLLYFFFWPLCCLFFFDIRILITPLVSSNSSCPFVLFLLAIVFSVLLRYTDSDYPFGIFKLFLERYTVENDGRNISALKYYILCTDGWNN